MRGSLHTFQAGHGTLCCNAARHSHWFLNVFAEEFIWGGEVHRANVIPAIEVLNRALPLHLSVPHADARLTVLKLISVTVCHSLRLVARPLPRSTVIRSLDCGADLPRPHVLIVRPLTVNEILLLDGVMLLELFLGEHHVDLAFGVDAHVVLRCGHGKGLLLHFGVAHVLSPSMRPRKEFSLVR